MALSPRPVTFQRLQVFCAVHERGSISAAARALGLSQPTASRHLRDLEAALGLALFRVDRGRIAPTPEADAIYEEARFLQDGLGRLDAQIEALRRGAGARLSVMCVGFLATDHLPRALAVVRRTMPHLRLDVDVGTADQQARAIEASRIDLGVAAGPAARAGSSRRAIGEGRLAALAPREHPLAAGRQVDLAGLAKADAVRLTPHGPIGRLLAEALAARGLSLDPGVTARSLLAAVSLARTLRRPVVEFTGAATAGEDMVLLGLRQGLLFEIAVTALATSGAVTVFTEALEEALSPRARSAMRASPSS